jgi:hypothetical protein
MNQKDATISQVYYLTFMCGSTCFGRFFAHHQELTTALAALLVVVWQITTNNVATTNTPTVKPEAANEVLRS